FVSVMFLTGAAKSLFTPLAMAVVFAMLPSYLLSRTLVPTLVRYLLPKEAELYRGRVGHTPGVNGEGGQLNPTGVAAGENGQSSPSAGAVAEGDQQNPAAGAAPRGDVIWRIGARFDRGFEKLHGRYRNALAWSIGHRLIICVAFILFCAVSFALFPFLGR